MLATMTALRKKDGGVRGIATGSSFRRLVAKTLAQQFSSRLRRARGQICHGRGPGSHSAVYRRSWCVRPCVPKFHDVEVVGDAQPLEALAVREISVWEAVVLQLERFR